jgi:hypothetical protein
VPASCTEHQKDMEGICQIYSVLNVSELELLDIVPQRTVRRKTPEQEIPDIVFKGLSRRKAMKFMSKMPQFIF